MPTSSSLPFNTKPLFNYESLKVYQKSLLFCRFAQAAVEPWDSAHAIVNHLPLAADSVVENIATASALFSGAKQSTLDVALGSSLECAACLDIAGIKRFLDEENLKTQKAELLAIHRMLIGLRRSWTVNTVREPRATYGYDVHEPIHPATPLPADQTAPKITEIFSHEHLDIYRLALEMMAWFHRVSQGASLAKAEFRKLDSLLTSVVLNIAEGNGRFSKTDQRRFVVIAHTSAIKTAAHLDLCILKGSLEGDCADTGKRLLARICSMTTAMASKIGSSAKIDEVRDEARDEVGFTNRKRESK